MVLNIHILWDGFFLKKKQEIEVIQKKIDEKINHTNFIKYKAPNIIMLSCMDYKFISLTNYSDKSCFLTIWNHI